MDAFVNPVIYFLLSYNLNDLNQDVKIFGITFKAREYVLPDLMYMFILIWGEFLLLLTYGVISPYAALAIGVNICSQLYVVRASICRYYYLQFHGVEDKRSVERDHKHLENICQNCQKNIHAILWPGITTSSILFSLYLFDMAYDTDHPTLGAPLTVMFLTLATVPCAMMVYYHYSKKAQKSLQTRVSEIVELQELGAAAVKNPMGESAQ